MLLKLIANADNPSRTKDITDIEHILDVYFELNAVEIFQEFSDVPDLYDTADKDYLRLVSANVIGRIIGGLLASSSDLKKRVLEILSRKTVGNYWAGMAAGIMDR